MTEIVPTWSPCLEVVEHAENFEAIDSNFMTDSILLRKLIVRKQSVSGHGKNGTEALWQ
jgi:hypothetical protein